MSRDLGPSRVRIRTRPGWYLLAAVVVVGLATRYFPEEEEHVAAYLNLRYYKFKP